MSADHLRRVARREKGLLPEGGSYGHFVHVILLSICAFLSLSKFALSGEFATPKDVTVDILVSLPRDMTKSRDLNNFDLGPDGVPIVLDGPDLLVLGANKKFHTFSDLSVSNFAWMRNGSLLVVSQDQLADLGPGGLTLGPTLPSTQMRIRAAGANTAYVFGGANEPGNHNVYVLARDKTFLKLITLPTPVVDVTGDGATHYIATSRSLLRIGVPDGIAILLQTSDDIISIASSSQGGVFYATRTGVGYVEKSGAPFEFIRGQSGVLRVQGSSLYFLATPGPQLFRIGPIERFEGLFDSSAELQPHKATGSAPPVGPSTRVTPLSRPAPLPGPQTQTREANKLSERELLSELRQRLYELNFDPAEDVSQITDVDRRAIVAFEEKNGLPKTGEATVALLNTLRSAGDRSPWASIVFDKKAGKWGMAWDHASRRDAVATAVSRCGDPQQCNVELSFFGPECGAFAYSGSQWALAARANAESARQAALTDCAKGGGRCRVVASVCADGSNRR